MEFNHVSVMAKECMDALEPERGGIYVDCTAGGGGHSFEIAKRLPEGSRLICLDRDIVDLYVEVLSFRTCAERGGCGI